MRPATLRVDVCGEILSGMKILPALLLGLLLPAGAEEVRFERLACAVALPEGWARIEPPGQQSSVLEAEAPGGRKVRLFVVLNEDGAPVAGPAKRRRFESSGGRVTAEEETQVMGIPAYELSGSMTLEGVEVHTRVRWFATKDFVYGIQVVSDDDPGEDAELLGFLDSFRFLRDVPAPVTPAPPPPRPSPFSDVDERGRPISPYEKLGRWIGMAVVASIVYAVARSRRKG